MNYCVNVFTCDRPFCIYSHLLPSVPGLALDLIYMNEGIDDRVCGDLWFMCCLIYSKCMEQGKNAQRGEHFHFLSNAKPQDRREREREKENFKLIFNG